MRVTETMKLIPENLGIPLILRTLDTVGTQVPCSTQSRCKLKLAHEIAIMI
jgi:hypothetical protein